MPKPIFSSSVEVLLAVQRAAGADVGEGLGVEDALLDGPAERGAVGVLGAEVGVPGVEVRVEVEQRDRAVLLGDRAQQRQRDGVVAAEGHQAGAGAEQLVGRGLDRLDGLVDVERVRGDVAGVRDLGEGEGGGVLRRVVRAQQPGRLADRVAAEAGAGPVGDARSRRARRPRRRRRGRPRRGAAAGRRSRVRRTAGCGRSRPGRGAGRRGRGASRCCSWGLPTSSYAFGRHTWLCADMCDLDDSTGDGHRP